MTTAARIDALTVAQAARIMRDAYRRHRDSMVWLYAIQSGDDGPVKIGLTRRPPAERLAALQVGNPATLRGLAAWRALPLEEAGVHADFAEHRLRGEWFSPAPGLLRFVQRSGGDFEEWS